MASPYMTTSKVLPRDAGHPYLNQLPETHKTRQARSELLNELLGPSSHSTAQPSGSQVAPAAKRPRGALVRSRISTIVKFFTFLVLGR